MSKQLTPIIGAVKAKDFAEDLNSVMHNLNDISTTVNKMTQDENLFPPPSHHQFITSTKIMIKFLGSEILFLMYKNISREQVLSLEVNLRIDLSLVVFLL